MITVIGDTHGRDDHRLEGRAREAVRGSELVVHTGDFTTGAVLDGFERETGADLDGDGGSDGRSDLVAVYGNNDDAAVRERLPASRVVERAGIRFVVVHGHEHGGAALAYLGRQEDADVVVVGHSHRPEWRTVDGVGILDPGSHADPRWHRPAHAELEPTAEGLDGRFVSPDGATIEAFTLTPAGE